MLKQILNIATMERISPTTCGVCLCLLGSGGRRRGLLLYEGLVPQFFALE